jgi:hypothetical protein
MNLNKTRVVDRMSIEGIAEFQMKITDSFGNGITIKDRKIGVLKKAKECFVGLEAAEWIKLYYGFTMEGAKKFGQILIENSIIEPAYGDKTFQDNDSFYRFANENNFRENLHKYEMKIKKKEGNIPLFILENIQQEEEAPDSSKEGRKSRRFQKEDEKKLQEQISRQLVQQDVIEKTINEENTSLKIFHELVEVNNKIKELQAQISKEEEQIKEKEMRKENITNEIQSCVLQISNLEKRILESKNLTQENLKHFKGAFEDQMEKYKSEEEKRQNQIKEIEEKIQACENQLKGDYKQTDEDVVLLQKNAIEKENEFKKTLQQTRQIETMSELLKKQIKKEKNQEIELKQQLDLYMKEKKEFEEKHQMEISEYQSKIRSFILTSFSMKESEEVLKKEISNLQLEVQKLEEEKQLMKQALQSQNPMLHAYITKLNQNDPQIKEILLPKSKLTDEDVSKLMKAIESNTVLKRLDLSYNSGIKGECFPDFIATLENNSVLEEFVFSFI